MRVSSPQLLRHAFIYLINIVMALRSLPAAFFLLVCCSLAHAKQAPCLERTIAVSVSGGDGASVTSMDSVALQGSNAVTIRSIKPADRLPRVVLLIDTSRSMESSEPAAAVIAERFVSKLPAETEIGLAFFDSNYHPMASLNKDRSKPTFLLEALKNRQYYAKGLTALWSSVGEAAKMFGTPSLGDTIYVISDGGDNRSRTHMRDVLEALTGSGIRLFAAVLAGHIEIRRTPSELNGAVDIKDAAHATGGALLFDPDAPGGYYYSALDMVGKDRKPTRFAEDLNYQVSQLINYYRLEISLPEPIHRPQSWRLHIVSDGQSPTERLELIYPTLLIPCQ
jgi:hypothetical protein